MRRAPVLIALMCTAVLAPALALPAVALPAGAQGPVGSSADPFTAAQIELGRRLAPLHNAADAADKWGSQSDAAAYAGVKSDPATGTVTVYLTDRSAESRFRHALSSTAGAAAPSQVRFATGRFAERAVLAARTQLKSLARQLGVVTIAVESDGSGLTVTVSDATAARAGLTKLRTATKAAAATPLFTLDAAGGVKLVVGKGPIPASRLKDFAPWIAGEALSASGTPSSSPGYWCTSGIPGRRKSDNHSFLVSAGHCFGDGEYVYTGWAFDGTRNYIGRVTLRRPQLDALIIDTGSTGITAGREWDGTANNVYEVTSASNSQDGDLVCQDGYTSKIVCGLRVGVRMTWWVGNDLVDGRISKTTNGGISARKGDSGALVFNYNNTTRQARGIVSAYDGPNDSQMYFPEANDILNYFSMSLASSTAR